MYSDALGEQADSMNAIIEAMAKMQARTYQTIGAVMHPPKDKPCPLEYQFQWCRIHTTVQHENESVRYSLASLLTIMNETI